MPSESVHEQLYPSQIKKRLCAHTELDLPIKDLSPIFAREANSRKPIYQIHKWWARRLGSVFKALLLASFGLFDQNTRLERSEDSIRDLLSRKIVLDPLMGGGTSIIESLALGCRAIGVDINPVAWFITKKEVESLDFDSLRKTFIHIENSVGRRITSFYSTHCSIGHEADIMYTIWCKHTRCKGCSEDIRLFQNHVLSQKKSGNTVFCPSCFAVFQTLAEREAKCPRCMFTFNMNNGTVRRGVITCPHCQQRERTIDAVKRHGGPLPIKMLCIEFYCKNCGRGYKEPSILDLEKYQHIREDFARLKDTLPYPTELIPESFADSRPQSHGYRYFYQLFNERQLLSLSLLLEEIMKIKNLSTMEFMLLVFSACLETNNMLCRYETRWQKVSSCFVFPAYYPVERIAENNVWGTKYGRGTFVKRFKKLIRAKATNARPGKKMDVNRRIEPLLDGPKFTDLADSHNELISSRKRAFLVCENSESLKFLPSASIDLVLTDPPYFDNLEYSRLADFFFVWLRKGLGPYYPKFKGHTSANEREMIMDGSRDKDLNSLVKSLRLVLLECYRVLKRDGLLAFTFHHSKPWAWKGLAQALLGAKFNIVSTQYVRSEGRTGFRKKGNISYDVCVFCRKEYNPKVNKSLDDAVQHSEKWVQTLIAAGNNLKCADIQTIVMGELLNYSPSFLLSDYDSKMFENIVNKCVALREELEKTSSIDLSTNNAMEKSNILR